MSSAGSSPGFAQLGWRFDVRWRQPNDGRRHRSPLCREAGVRDLTKKIRRTHRGRRSSATTIWQAASGLRNFPFRVWIPSLQFWQRPHPTPNSAQSVVASAPSSSMSHWRLKASGAWPMIGQRQKPPLRSVPGAGWRATWTASTFRRSWILFATSNTLSTVHSTNSPKPSVTLPAIGS